MAPRLKPIEMKWGGNESKLKKTNGKLLTKPESEIETEVDGAYSSSI